jgi:hypothetical protein
MKKKYVLLFVAIMFLSNFLISCEKDNQIEPNTEAKQQVVVLNNTKKLSNKVLISKLKDRLSTVNKSQTARSFNTLDIGSATISDYNGTDVKAITVPISENLTYTTYSLGEDLTDSELLIDIKLENNIYAVKYFNLEGKIIGEFSVKDGVILNTKVMFSKKQSITGRFGSRFGRCVQANTSRMTDGSFLGSVYGLSCMAFGAQCAAGIALGCAAAAY